MASGKGLGTLTLDLVTRIAGFTGPLDQAARAAADRSKKIGKAMGLIGAAAGAAAVAVGAAAVSWTRDVMDLGVELDKLSQISKSSVQDFQKWAVGAASVGISQEKLSDQLKDFNEKLGEFHATGGGGMKDFFEQIAPKIGITADAFKNLSGPQALQLYYNSLEKANLSQEQLSFYLESMASDTTALIPLLRNGGEGFRKWGDEAQRLGAILDDDTLKAIQGVREQSARLDQIMLGLKVTVASELLPPFERFTSLLSDQQTQDGLRTLIDGLGKATGVAVTFAEKIAQAGIAYKDFLANQGALPAGQLDSEEQIKLRIKKLSGMAYGDGLLDQIRRGVFGDAINEELSEAINELNGFQWRNVTGGASSTYDQPKGGGKPTATGTKGGKTREMPDFAKDAHDELQRLVAIEAQAREQFDALAAQLAGPVAAAHHQYKVDLAELNELAKLGAIDSESLRVAREQLTEAYQDNVRALEAQLTPAEEALRLLQEETLWLTANDEGQRRLAASRMLGVDATEAQIEAAMEHMRVNEQLGEQMRQWDQLNGTISDTLFDVVSGSKSASDAIKDFFDTLHKQILRNLTDDLADSMTNWMKGFMSNGNSGWASANGIGAAVQVGNNTSGGNGGFWSGLMGALWGGGRAAGGSVVPGKFYEVGEQDRPEILMSKGKQYLIPGNEGTVVPMRGRGGGSITQNFHLHNPRMQDSTTDMQKVGRQARKLQRFQAMA